MHRISSWCSRFDQDAGIVVRCNVGVTRRSDGFLAGFWGLEYDAPPFDRQAVPQVMLDLIPKPDQFLTHFASD